MPFLWYVKALKHKENEEMKIKLLHMNTNSFIFSYEIQFLAHVCTYQIDDLKITCCNQTWLLQIQKGKLKVE